MTYRLFCEHLPRDWSRIDQVSATRTIELHLLDVLLTSSPIQGLSAAKVSMLFKYILFIFLVLPVLIKILAFSLSPLLAVSLVQ